MNEISVWHFNHVPSSFTGKATNYAKTGVGWFEKGKPHRLDGPAYILELGGEGYSEFIIHGVTIPKEQYWKHPLVLSYPPNILKILNHILQINE